MAVGLLAWYIACCLHAVAGMLSITAESGGGASVHAEGQFISSAHLLAENTALKEQVRQLLEELEFMKHKITYRCPQFTGPFPRDWSKQGECITEDLMWDYTLHGQIPFGFDQPDKDASKKLMEQRKQREEVKAKMPDGITEFWPADKCREQPDTQLGGGVEGCLLMRRFRLSQTPFWSKHLIDLLVGRVQKGEDISPKDYWHSAPDVKKAVEVAGLKGKDVLVAGSISPWVESVLLASGVEQVTSCDYSPPMSDHPGISTLSMEEVLKPSSGRTFDSILSYSSLEHDGLGRYGDPFNPVGDFAAVRELNRLLKPGGLLLLGVPTQPSDDLPFNSGRVYGPLRMPKLIEHSGLVFEGFMFDGNHTPGPLPLHDLDSPFWKHNRWAEHAIMFLRKPQQQQTPQTPQGPGPRSPTLLEDGAITEELVDEGDGAEDAEYAEDADDASGGDEEE